jgi:hypothetical protein
LRDKDDPLTGFEAPDGCHAGSGSWRRRAAHASRAWTHSPRGSATDPPVAAGGGGIVFRAELLKLTKEHAMSLSTEEIERRIADLQDSGMTLAARALIRELNFRQKHAAD